MPTGAGAVLTASTPEGNLLAGVWHFKSRQELQVLDGKEHGKHVQHQQVPLLSKVSSLQISDLDWVQAHARSVCVHLIPQEATLPAGAVHTCHAFIQQKL
eukprot:1137841-Pelagomonas_calceolata.AAC.6